MASEPTPADLAKAQELAAGYVVTTMDIVDQRRRIARALAAAREEGRAESKHVADGSIVKCPKCKYTGDIQTFDILGADDDKVWCNQCGEQFVPTLCAPAAEAARKAPQ